MKKVEFEYKVWWWPRKWHKKTAIPAMWNELNSEQFIAVVQSLRGNITLDDYYSTLIGISPRTLNKVDDWTAYVIHQQLAWLDGGKPEASRMIIPSVEGLMAPGDALDGVTFQHFITADTFFDYFSRTLEEGKMEGDVSKLCRFVAALYLRKNEKYMLHPVRRTIFDLPGQHDKLVDIDANASMLEKCADRDILYAIFFNWVLIRAWLSRIYPMVFPEDDADTSGKPAVRNVWLNAFDSFVGDDVAHMDEYRQMACTDAFRLMNKRIKDALIKN